MELSLHVHRPLSDRGNFPSRSYLKIMPDHLSFSTGRWDGTSLFTPCYKLLPQMRASSSITATSDYSRRRQRKSQIPRTGGSAPKGFIPKPPVGTSTQKRDPVDDVEKEESGPATSTEYTAPVKSTKTEAEVDSEKSPRIELISKTIPSSSKAKTETKILEEETEVLEGGVQETIEKKDQISYKRKPAMLTVESKIVEQSPLAEADQDLTEPERPKILDEIEEEKRASVTEIEREKNPHEHRKHIENLAKESFSSGIKVFVYPQMVKPDQEIAIFLNRAISTLKDEPNILIMGAFNDWRWKSFTKPLEKTDFGDDWWSCKVFVPREAYKIDFVFFDGGSVYDNNDSKDFFIPVEGGMDFFTFDDFLLDEKRRELQRLAAEEAERKRKAEEQRRIEAEKAAELADKAQAKVEVEKLRENLRKVINKAVVSVENVWHIVPSEFKWGHLVRLYYNRQTGPLAHSGELWLHGGYNSWKDGLSIVGRLVRTNKEGGDWWYANVIVPDRALVLDWVFADGPPESARVYDNNNFQDFHAIVPEATPEELYWVEEMHQVYKKLQKERRLREEALRAKAEKTAHMKAETKEKTMKMFLLSQKHIVYTDPLEVQAGSIVTVYYNPSNTVLSGKPEVWFRCSFNHWTHRHGPLPPQKMIPAENRTHVKMSVKVPLDAYIMDFVFSEKEDGGIYDNKNGMDYHIPVVGGISKEPPMHIVHIAVEMAPIAKVGGLGDVVTSLSRAVQDLGHNVDIILPKYDCMNLTNVKDFQFHRSYAWGGTEIKVWYGKVEGLPVYFLEPQNGLFRVGCIYGRGNDGERFGFFCHAALEFLLQSGFHPDIVHCHDWSSAPVAWLFKDHYRHYGLSKARVVFTIHNLEFGAALIGKAMVYSDKATTVSPNYSREISGNPVIAPHLYKFHGIVNGIDHDIWDPFNDKFLPISYTSENVVEGKKAAKEALQERLGLKRSDHPLVGIITRLTAQKGIHLMKHAIWRTLDRNGQVVLLGSAPDPRIQNDFVNLANQLHSSHSDRARLCLTYDEPLSHLIYAGADFMLVPSIFEPCGLTQLIAMRYGSIPVVRKTGGLYDTVFDIDHDKERAEAVGLEPNGFSFDGADPAGVDYALNRAITVWYDGGDRFYSLCKRVMEQDWSWNRPALDYMELYYAARK
ncbi:starch synthase 3, chloroplastic/amyloplastic [Aristolochia californica]|uniref:starch synthase 3, chloroplastic/amyloplastic n=1 Tax=Aristolochia californica TaxID=171875 RepID=UPI0035D857D3